MNRAISGNIIIIVDVVVIIIWLLLPYQKSTLYTRIGKRASEKKIKRERDRP